MLIGDIYEVVSEQLLSSGRVKYVDLWNHNVEFIEQETQWPMPAVFVEFSPIDWQPTVPGVRYVTEASINLHIVTEWKGGTSSADEDKSLDVPDLLDDIHSLMRLVNGDSFKELHLAKTVMNHNHEDIVETIERYDYVGYLTF